MRIFSFRIVIHLAFIFICHQYKDQEKKLEEEIYEFKCLLFLFSQPTYSYVTIYLSLKCMCLCVTTTAFMDLLSRRCNPKIDWPIYCRVNWVVSSKVSYFKLVVLLPLAFSHQNKISESLINLSFYTELRPQMRRKTYLSYACESMCTECERAGSTHARSILVRIKLHGTLIKISHNYLTL